MGKEPYAAAEAGGVRAAGEHDGRAAQVELEGRLYLMGLKAFRHSTLSVGSVVGYLYLRETEVGNLRRIARGMEFNVPKDRIQETLVVI